MKILLIIALILLMLPGGADAGLITGVKKVVTAEWVSDAWLKYGFLASLCAAQGFNGLVESHKYSGNKIVSDSDYHVYRYGQSLSMLAAGYFTSANIRSKDLSFIKKTRRISGATLIARDCFEWMYRANRTGDPFNYSDQYSFNDKALVYFKFNWNEGKFIDMYISGTGRQGAMIDAACLLIGNWLFD